MPEQNLYVEIEAAIKMLAERLGRPNDSSKALLFHSIKVGNLLYSHGYSRDIVLAGFLHDIMEDPSTSPDEISKNFGTEVALLVAANTKSPNISDDFENSQELIRRCIGQGEGASVVKAADILDFFDFYRRSGSQAGVEKSQHNAKYLVETIAGNYHDPIFNQLAMVAAPRG